MLAAQRPDWKGETVACIASGPSLTREDVELVHRAEVRTIVTNTTFRLAPWADVLFGFDLRWWREYVKEVDAAQFTGKRMCATPNNLGIESAYQSKWMRVFGNSGACAISLAVAGGARRVILLGVDAMRSHSGAWHWHGDHPAGMSNCLSMKRWGYQFAKAAEYARANGTEVLNCSRRTALDCFPRVDLEEALRSKVEACAA